MLKLYTCELSGPIFTSRVLEVADEFLLLGVDGDRWLAGGDGALDRRGDVLELRIAIDVARPLERLSIALKRIAKLLQQGPDNVMADAMTHGAKRVGQVAQAFRRPLQRRERIAPRGGIDKPLQVAEKRRVRLRQRLASSALAPDAAKGRIRRIAAQFPQSIANRAARDPRRLAHRCDPTPSRGKRFCRRKAPPTPLIQHRVERLIAELYRSNIDHRPCLQSNA